MLVANSSTTAAQNLLATWRTNNRVTEFFFENLPSGLWNMTPFFTVFSLCLSLATGCAGSASSSENSSIPLKITYYTPDKKLIALSRLPAVRREGEILPSVIQRISPQYPPVAIRAGASGYVSVKVWIASDGKPTKVVAVQTDHEILNQAVIDAALNWRFGPHRKDGMAQDFIAFLPFRFELRGNNPIVILPD